MMELTVYSSNGCPACVAVTMHLDRNGVNYKVAKVDEDAEAMAFFKAQGHRTVPQVYTPDGVRIASNLMELVKLPSGVLEVFK